MTHIETVPDLQMASGPSRSPAALVQRAKAGERIHTEHSLHAEVWDQPCPGPHRWRVIACDGESDVNECHVCGAQAVYHCDEAVA